MKTLLKMWDLLYSTLKKQNPGLTIGMKTGVIYSYGIVSACLFRITNSIWTSLAQMEDVREFEQFLLSRYSLPNHALPPLSRGSTKFEQLLFEWLGEAVMEQDAREALLQGRAVKMPPIIQGKILCAQSQSMKCISAQDDFTFIIEKYGKVDKRARWISGLLSIRHCHKSKYQRLWTSTSPETMHIALSYWEDVRTEEMCWRRSFLYFSIHWDRSEGNRS